jgi:hypothetical protein
MGFGTFGLTNLFFFIYPQIFVVIDFHINFNRSFYYKNKVSKN